MKTENTNTSKDRSPLFAGLVFCLSFLVLGAVSVVKYYGTFVGTHVGDGAGMSNVVVGAAAAPVQNFFTTNLYVSTNYVDYFNSYSNAYITFNSNAVFNQNISVSGKANFTQIIITNNFLTSTNAFPIAAGTTWDWSKYYQRIITNADFNVTAIGGLSNNLLNQAMLQVSNSGASQIICHLQFAMTKFGPLTTNDVYIASAKQAEIDGNAPGIGTSTNIATVSGQ